ncbi:MAG: hypothetical protein Q7T20_10570 [Saprospiraceae bacterium]|nr:hypothetical protein [Saprospiraceae bacterium]
MGISIQERKLHIIGRLASSEDENLIELIENLLFDETDQLDNEVLNEEESGLLRDRIAGYHADAEDEIPWDEVKASLKANHALRS